MTNSARRFRPSLVKLTRDQDDVIEELIAGLEDRPDVLRWSQRLSVRTLGLISDEWFTAIVNRPDVLEVLTGEGAGRRAQREQLATRNLSPACRRAYHMVRERAHEYFGESKSGEIPDAEEQEFLAMRPSLTELDNEQRRCIDIGLRGVDDRAELRSWATDLRTATEGQLDEDFASWILEHPRPRRAMLRELEAPRGEIVRASMLVSEALPSMNQGTRSLQASAGESVQKIKSGMSIPTA